MYKVMIVDDEPTSLDFLHSLIDWEKEGFTIIASVTSALQAVSLLSVTSPDLVIFDIKMPQMTGAELSGIIRQNYPDMKMIAMSGFDDFDYVREVMLNGAVDYLLKHRVTSESLKAALDKVKRELSDKEETGLWLPEHREMIHVLAAEGNVRDLERLISGILSRAASLEDSFCHLAGSLLKEKECTPDEDLLLFRYESLRSMAARGEKENLIEALGEIIHSWYSPRVQCSPVVEAAIRLIDNNFRMNLTLEDAAQVIGVNSAYLSRLFHKETNQTFIEALTARRIDEAKKAMKRGENLKSVASLCGFQSYSYFFKVFRKQVGMTPVSYLEEVEKVKKLQ